jgi:hypothetical protein
MRDNDLHLGLHLGEIGLRLEYAELGNKHRGKPKPIARGKSPAVSGNCKHNRHTQCTKVNCTCACHPNGGKI